LTANLLSTAVQVGNTFTSSAVVFLPSTVTGLGSSGYISTPTFVSAFVSTTQGLGSAGYLSSISIDPYAISTAKGFGTLGYVSTSFFDAQLTSTTIGLGTLGYISSGVFTGPLASTIQGLGSSGYISTSQLTSSLIGLGSINYVSTSQLTSSLSGLGSLGFLSTSQLTSSLTGIGSLGFLSTPQLTSSVRGLGSSGYVSTSQLVSSVTGLGSLGYLSSVQIFRSTYSNTNATGWSNIGYLYNNISTNTISLSTIRFDMGTALRSKIIPSTTRLDIELKPFAQFAYYDGTSGAYQYNSFLVRGGPFAQSNVIGQESLTYYILNANPINLPFFFQEKARFLVNNPTILSTLKNDASFSTLSLHHTFGAPIPTTNQFFASPASSICASVVLDNTAS
jgi:hypothetical protein